MKLSIIAFALAAACCSQAWAQSETGRDSALRPSPMAAEAAPSAAAGGSAATNAGSAASSRLFRELDLDGDGYLSEDELRSERARQGNWASMDRDGDGRIAPDEFIAIPR